MAGLDLTLWVTILATWLLAVGTLAFAYWQLRQNQRLHSTSTLLDLRERFYSPRLQRARKELSRWLLQAPRGEEPYDWEVALFFQLLGSLTRTRTLDRRLVRNAFGTWITAYYTFMTRPVDLLASWRDDSNDPQIFADFEWLAQQIIGAERRATPGADFEQSLMDEARFVLEGDSHLDAVA